MSSPSRQVSSRRLPPLPNQSLYKLKENKYNSDDFHDEKFSRNGIGNSCSCGCACCGRLPKREQLSKVLAANKAKEYLSENPDVLDEYIMETIGREQLERWLIRKMHPLNSAHENSDERVVNSLSRWRFCVHTDKRKLLEELAREIHHHPNKVQVMYELVKSIATATHADRYSLYLPDKNGTEIYLYSPDKPRSRDLLRQPICTGTTVAAHVAETCEKLIINDILKEDRFPSGIGIEDTTAQSILCHPIIQTDGELAGIVELVNHLGNAQFDAEEEEITSSYLTWGSIAIHYAQLFKRMQKQKDLHDFLLQVIKSIFDEVHEIDVVIGKIMAFAKKLVNADRCALFLLDSKTMEMYANLFDNGEEHEDGSLRLTMGNEIRFPMDKGIAGHVASTGEILNIHNAYQDKRFNREVDQKTGYTTKSILCMPVMSKGRSVNPTIIGVVELVNKKSGIFTHTDEIAFEMFAGYCGLALHYSQVYWQLMEAQRKHQVSLEVLSYHSTAFADEVQDYCRALREENVPEELYRFTFNIYQDDNTLTVLFSHLAQELLSKSTNRRLDLDVLIRFTLTVRKNYRPVKYHNWSHAFSVAHFVFLVFRLCNGLFTELEQLSLFVAAICHDLDHRGKNNDFMVNSKSALGELYSKSTMEWHHFNQTVFILERSGHNIFDFMNARDYKQVLAWVEEAILATDLSRFFGNCAILNKLLDEDNFSWDNLEHKSRVRCMIMTAADLCAVAKPWPIYTESVRKVIDEFYEQGDEEKKMGKTPNPMMDRNNHHQLPGSQIGFIKGVVSPCFKCLSRILPDAKPLLDEVNRNMEKWVSFVDGNETAETLGIEFLMTAETSEQ